MSNEHLKEIRAEFRTPPDNEGRFTIGGAAAGRIITHAEALAAQLAAEEERSANLLNRLAEVKNELYCWQAYGRPCTEGDLPESEEQS